MEEAQSQRVRLKANRFRFLVYASVPLCIRFISARISLALLDPLCGFVRLESQGDISRERRIVSAGPLYENIATISGKISFLTCRLARACMTRED